jgi:hypothetical protein
MESGRYRERGRERESARAREREREKDKERERKREREREREREIESARECARERKREKERERERHPRRVSVQKDQSTPRETPVLAAGELRESLSRRQTPRPSRKHLSLSPLIFLFFSPSLSPALSLARSLTLCGTAWVLLHQTDVEAIPETPSGTECVQSEKEKERDAEREREKER